MHQQQERKNRKNNKLYFSNRLVQVIFLLLGLPFLGISIVFYLALHNTLDQDSQIFILVFGGIGLLFILMAVALGLWNVREKRRIQTLREEGLRRYASVLNVAVSSSVQINNQSPYVLHAQIQEGEQVFLFKSKFLRIDPTPFLKSNVVVVYQQRNNPKNYFVDVEESMTVTLNFL